MATSRLRSFAFEIIWLRVKRCGDAFAAELSKFMAVQTAMLPRVITGLDGSNRVTNGDRRTTGQFLHGAITKKVLETFFDVYNELGAGFLETVYVKSLARALRDAGLHVDAEVPIDVFFRHEVVGRYFADIVVENRLVVEIKAVRTLRPEHEAQLMHYLRATSMEVGLLLNFGHQPQLKRVVYSNTLKSNLGMTRGNP